jgi:hypothetical protein
MTQPEAFHCPFDQKAACAVAVGALGDKELAVQDARVRYTQGEKDIKTVALSGQYEQVASGAYGIEVLGLAAMTLDSGVTCGARCPIQVEINLRENMRGNPGVQPQS